MNELPQDHTAKMHNAETHLKTSHLQWSYNYFSWQDCSTLSLLRVMNTKLFRTCSVPNMTATWFKQRHKRKDYPDSRCVMAGRVQGEYSTHFPMASLFGERKRTRALIPLSNLDSFSPFTGNLIVFLAIKRNGSQEELWIRHAPSNLQCPVLPLKRSRCTVCIN